MCTTTTHSMLARKARVVLGEATEAEWIPLKIGTGEAAMDKCARHAAMCTHVDGVDCGWLSGWAESGVILFILQCFIDIVKIGFGSDTERSAQQLHGTHTHA